VRARALAREIAASLERAGVDDARFEAEYLVRIATGLTRAEFFIDPELEGDAERAARELGISRSRRTPAAQLAGVREFYGLRFAVNRDVLAPRPETELLVDIALAEAPLVPGPVIVDVGTGSGAVAVAVAHVLGAGSPATVVATEVSPAALTVARRNALMAPRGVTLLRCDLAAAVGRADIVLANLPYVPTGEIEALEPEVSAWEPRVALDGGSDGLRPIERLLADCAHRLRPRLLALEVGAGMAADVASRAACCGASAEVRTDLAGIERVVIARWR
jgi:release factor glutamine methyltransferase